MVRLGWGARITADLGPPTLFHAVSQGALGIEVRADDAEAIALCEAISHWPTAWACRAERSCLRVLEGGCSVPVGVSTDFKVLRDEGAGRRGTIEITGTVTALDGSRHVQHTVVEELGSPEDADEVGAKLARVLIETGAKEILEEINADRETKIKEAQATGQTVDA